ncbi:MAG: alpha-hydroxy acid oxidase [Pseudomonadota bacterium]
MSLLTDFFAPRTPDQRFPSIATMERAAQRRTPRFAWDYLAGGIGVEDLVARNRSDFERVRFMPRYLQDPVSVSTDCTVLGQSHPVPFGTSPVGLSGLIWPNAPLHIANGAKHHGIVGGLSSVATNSIEEIGAILGERLWFQLYPMTKTDAEEDLLKRFRAVGGDVLLVTVDVPGPTRRSRDIGNGLSVPPRRDWRLYLQGAMRPRWALETLRVGMPRFKSILDYVPSDDDTSVMQYLTEVFSRQSGLDRLKRYRDLWPGKLVVKGLLGLEDVRTAIDVGIDGIVVSNHGGRQLDAAPTAIDVLPAIRQTVGGKMDILVDGGVRTGLDIARYLALGADFVMMGRPMVFSVAAMGEQGPAHALHILRKEFETTLNQIGCADYRDLGTFIHQT